MLQSARQFQSSATDKRLIVAENANFRVAVDTGACLFNLLLVYQHAACQNKRLRALARGREPALQQQFVEPRSHAAQTSTR